MLENLILRGDASARIHTHALSGFGAIPIQKGCITIIEKIMWFPFIDFPWTPFNTYSWNAWLTQNEYQLKIDTAKTQNNITFKNTFKMTNTNNFDMNSAVDATFPYMCILPEAPVMIDTFFVASDYCKITITRSAFSSGNNTMGTVSPKTAEQNVPNGIANMQEAKRVQGVDLTGAANAFYTPAGDDFAGLPPAGLRSHQNYVPDYVLPNGAFYNSQLTPPYSNILGSRANAPCVNFFLVDINEQAAKALQTTK